MICPHAPSPFNILPRPHSQGELLIAGKMANSVAFQSKLTSIMEMLTKAAVVEISKLWEDGFALVQVELRRREIEIEALNRKLLLMEKERLEARAQSANNSSSSFSKREQQNKLLPPAGDGKNNRGRNRGSINDICLKRHNLIPRG